MIYFGCNFWSMYAPTLTDFGVNMPAFERYFAPKTPKWFWPSQNSSKKQFLSCF